jgi:hypothetical protein
MKIVAILDEQMDPQSSKWMESSEINGGKIAIAKGDD